MNAQRFLLTIDGISTWFGKAAAWLIVEQLRAEKRDMILLTVVDEYRAQFSGPGGRRLASADTAPLAICRVALKATLLPP